MHGGQSAAVLFQMSLSPTLKFTECWQAHSHIIKWLAQLGQAGLGRCQQLLEVIPFIKRCMLVRKGWGERVLVRGLVGWWGVDAVASRRWCEPQEKLCF